MPPDENIHKVANGGDHGDVLTISMHVYGANIALLGSSINEVFELPVLERVPARPLAWRATRPALT